MSLQFCLTWAEIQSTRMAVLALEAHHRWFGPSAHDGSFALVFDTSLRLILDRSMNDCWLLLDRLFTAKNAPVRYGQTI